MTPDYTLEPVDADALPSPTDLASGTLSLFMDNIVPMLMVGLGLTLIGLVSLFVTIPVAIGSLCLIQIVAGGAAAGLEAATGSETIAAVIAVLLGLGGYLIAGLLFIGVSSALTGPFSGSFMRAMDRQLAGGVEVSFGDIFSTAFDQPAKDILSTAILGLAILLGLPFCYVGALVPAFFLMWFTWSCELDSVPLGTALRRSVRAVLARPGWCAVVFLLTILFSMIGGYIPILGPVATVLFMLRAYRAIFPRLTEA